MRVNELYEILKKIIEEGKGDYIVSIETIDGFIENAYGVDSCDKYEEIYINGC